MPLSLVKDSMLVEFLGIEDSDRALLASYQSYLQRYCRSFAREFRQYLQGSPATRSFLQDYKNNGQDVEELISQQLDSLQEMLWHAPTHQHYDFLIAHGAFNQSKGIEPEWVLGLYQRYLTHLISQIRQDTSLGESDKSTLRNCITKILFRDMGLVIGGYWTSTLTSLAQERQKVGSLQEQMNSLLTNIPQLLWSFDVTGQTPIYLSPSLSAISSVESEYPIPFYNNTIKEDRKSLESAWLQALQGHRIEIESRVQLTGQPLRWYKRMLYPFKDNSGKVVRIDGIMEDITELKLSLERLNTLATTDSLTGLTNRLLFNDRLDQALASAARTPHQQLAVLLMDLNHFKEVNDTLGHQVGDEVLIQVAQRLRKQISRKTDTLARLGGDEFGVLLTVTDNSDLCAETICRKIEEAFIEPLNIAGQEIYLGTSVGIARYPEHGEDASTLIRRADVAMYAAKRSALAYCAYHPALDIDAQQNFSLAADLRQAIKENQLYLEFQPKVNLTDQTVTSAEALIRWQHPHRGNLLPHEFIPIAERSSLICGLTKWVIENALAQIAHWKTIGLDIRVAVNLSAMVFEHWNQLTEHIETQLQHYQLPGSALEIEITENVLMTDLVTVRSMLEQVSELGVTIAIDDFGTGYSSLAYLKSLPLNTLKIDKSFVLDMISDENDKMIVKSTVDLAHNLGLSVIAEGIENEAALQLLTQWHCDSAQGFYLGRPERAGSFTNKIIEGEFLAKLLLTESIEP